MSNDYDFKTPSSALASVAFWCLNNPGRTCELTVSVMDSLGTREEILAWAEKASLKIRRQRTRWYFWFEEVARA
jgi:hypothetical protein